jgi:cellobiose phosphorylase
MFVKYGREYAELCKRRGLSEEAAKFFPRSRYGTYGGEYGWDGAWFLRAYDALVKVGSKGWRRRQIFIETQGFCVMAGMG